MRWRLIGRAMKTDLTRYFLAALLGMAFVFAPVLCAQDSDPGTIILDTSSFWRYHYTLKPPLIRKDKDGELRPLDVFLSTDYPPGDWASPGFEDSFWRRLPGPPFPPNGSWPADAQKDAGFLARDSSTPCLALICMRGKFEVADPARVKGLKLNIEYRGGIVAYINGKEVARSGLPEGGIKFDTPAVDYPDDAFHVVLKGNRVSDVRSEKDPEVLKKWALRKRRLENAEIPDGVLRKGVNVLAIEIHRSPYRGDLPELCAKLRNSRNVTTALWCTCDLMKIRLIASSADGIRPNVARPKGIQIWNSDILSPDFDLDWGDPHESLRPVRIVGTRNGAFSGKVVVGSTETIKGLNAAISDFIGENGARIAASNIQIRYPTPNSTEGGSASRYPAQVHRFDALLETSPAEVPVRVKNKGRGNWVVPGQPPHVNGAVQPVWFTVRVPTDARPGEYKSELTIRVEGAEPFKVAVVLKVCGWKLPEPHEYRAWAEFVQSPDALAVHYGVPLWSDKHWEMIEKSLMILGEMGDKSIYIPLIAETNQGNAESMVRWIKKDGNYDYDFTVMDKYLDLVQRHQKRPKVVCLYVWDLFLAGSRANSKYSSGAANTARTEYEGKGPEVTVFDPAAGKTEKMFLPRYEAPKSKPLWKPLLERLRENLKKRGLEGSMMLGMISDCYPKKEEIAFFSKLLPGVPWVQHCHGPRDKIYDAKVAYRGGVWSTKYATTPADSLLYGWKERDNVHTQFRRGRWDSSHVLVFSHLCELNVMGAQRGFARMGAEYWKIYKDERGRLRHGVGKRYSKAEWRNLDIESSVLAPGPDGPVSTARLELMREGLQECEARIFVEKAIVEKKISGKLAERCQEVLAERTLALQIANKRFASQGFKKRDHWNRRIYLGGCQVTYQWYLASGWQKRSEKLFETAAEVAKAFRNE